MAARGAAQQAATPVIGWIHGGSPDTSVPFVSAFRDGLGETGFIEAFKLRRYFPPSAISLSCSRRVMRFPPSMGAARSSRLAV